MQNMQATIFTLHFLVGNCMSTCTVMFTFKIIPVKSKSVFFHLLFTTGGTVETRYDRTELLQYCTILYSIAYSEQNIHETHKKKKTVKSPDRKGGRGIKSTKLLHLISAIFRVRPHVFINITSDIIQGDAPGIKTLGRSDPPLAVMNCDEL